MARAELPAVPVRRLVSGTLAVTAVIVFFWLLFRFYVALLLFLTAVLISTALKPGVRWLEGRGLPKPAGILAIYGCLVLMVLLLAWYSAPVLAVQGAAIGQSLGDGYQYLLDWLRGLPNILIRRLVATLPADLALLPGVVEETAVSTAVITEAAPSPTLTQIWAQTNLILKALFHLAAIFILAFFWTLEGERLKQAAFLLVPMPNRTQTRELVQEMEARISGYFLGQGLLCLIIGVISFVAYSLIGLPNALLLAILAGLFEAIPIIGPFLGAAPAVAVGLSISPATALWAVLAAVIIQQLEGSLLVPRVMNRTVGVRPLVTLLSLLAFTSLFGILGALIALPLAVVAQLLLDRFLLDRDSLTQEEPGRDRLSLLRYETNQLVQDVRNQIRRKEDAPSAMTDEYEDEVEAIALDLETFLVQSVVFLPAAPHEEIK